MQNPNDFRPIFFEIRENLYFCASYVEYRRTIPEKLQNLDTVCFKIRCKVIETDNQCHPTDSGAVLAVPAGCGPYCKVSDSKMSSYAGRLFNLGMKKGMRQCLTGQEPM